MTSGVRVYDGCMDTNTAQAARVEDNAFKVAIMNELKAHELDVRSFDTGEHDLGISADVITVGLGVDKIVQSAVGEYIVWKSLVARHDSPKSNRHMYACGEDVMDVNSLTMERGMRVWVGDNDGAPRAHYRF